ncbi:MAG TPA: methyltransferase [Rhodobacteraceae bacterium]|nr:methyltransferase [Paracoccaceae bacterium]
MTLKAELLARIAASGPMTLADYMAECLLHPRYGYYSTRDPLGAAGDFTTAPEISQMFGEMLGLALAQSWLDQGAPSPFTLAELGPGRGTLMADVLRATARVPGFHAALNVVLVEASPTLRAAQAQRVPHAKWADTIAELPDAPLFLLANEFFDALPIRQFHRAAGDTWREVVVGIEASDLRPGLAPPAPHAPLDQRLSDTRPGDIVETCPAAAPIVTRIGEILAAHGGAALLIDYGAGPSLGDTFQALENHRFADPFANPGHADLTAHVDFIALARAAQPLCATSAITPQGRFLEHLGITPRAQSLAPRLSGPALESHIAAHRRLTHPDEMGSLFKVLGLTPHFAPPFPGLIPDHS